MREIKQSSLAKSLSPENRTSQTVAYYERLCQKFMAEAQRPLPDEWQSLYAQVERALADIKARPLIKEDAQSQAFLHALYLCTDWDSFSDTLDHFTAYLQGIGSGTAPQLDYGSPVKRTSMLNQTADPKGQGRVRIL